MNRKIRIILGLAAMGGLFCLPWLILGLAPDESRLGQSYRIFYLHLPLSWWGLFSFFSVCISSLIYLRRGKGSVWAEAATETGLIFMGLGVLTGMFWAKQSWGVWWRWEPKLFTALLLCLLFGACLLLRKRRLPLEREKKLAAALSIIAFVNVPFIFMASSAFPGGAHPPLLVLRGGLAGEMWPPLLGTLLISGLAWLWLSLLRWERIARKQDNMDKEMQNKLE